MFVIPNIVITPMPQAAFHSPTPIEPCGKPCGQMKIRTEVAIVPPVVSRAPVILFENW
ncbi:Uncharacterised protein, partial [Mesomycoplasma hyorhinis]